MNTVFSTISTIMLAKSTVLCWNMFLCDVYHIMPKIMLIIRQGQFLALLLLMWPYSGVHRFVLFVICAAKRNLPEAPVDIGVHCH